MSEEFGLDLVQGATGSGDFRVSRNVGRVTFGKTKKASTAIQGTHGAGSKMPNGKAGGNEFAGAGRAHGIHPRVIDM
jgi:hypothetical protein